MLDNNKTLQKVISFFACITSYVCSVLFIGEGLLILKNAEATRANCICVALFIVYGITFAIKGFNCSGWIHE